MAAETQIFKYQLGVDIGVRNNWFAKKKKMQFTKDKFQN